MLTLCRVTLLSLIAMLALASTAAAAAAADPIIVVFVLDDAWCHSLLGETEPGDGCPAAPPSGESFPTVPAMDSMRTAGAYTPIFQTENRCTPTRASILTGRFPMWNGSSLGDPNARSMSGEYEWTFFEGARARGYRTALLGKLGFKYYRPGEIRGTENIYEDLGIDVFDGFVDNVPQGGQTDWWNTRMVDDVIIHEDQVEADYVDLHIADAAINYVNSLGPADRTVMVVAFAGPHGPHVTPPTSACSEPTLYECYELMVEYVDTQIARVTAAVEVKWPGVDTLFITVTDDGATIWPPGNPLQARGTGGDMTQSKGTNKEMGVHGSMILSGSALDSGFSGDELTGNFSSVDIFATIMDAVDATPTIPTLSANVSASEDAILHSRYNGQPYYTQGRSFWPYIATGTATNPHDVSITMPDSGGVKFASDNYYCTGMDVADDHDWEWYATSCWSSVSESQEGASNQLCGPTPDECTTYFTGLGGASLAEYDVMRARHEELRTLVPHAFPPTNVNIGDLMGATVGAALLGLGIRRLRLRTAAAPQKSGCA